MHLQINSNLLCQILSSWEVTKLGMGARSCEYLYTHIHMYYTLGQENVCVIPSKNKVLMQILLKKKVSTYMQTPALGLLVG